MDSAKILCHRAGTFWSMTDMAFDTTTYAAPATTIDPVVNGDALCPIWAAENPDKALAFLYVAPQDCAAVDVLMAG